MNSRTVGLEKLLCILCLCPLLLCEAGSLRLLNGESRSGKLAMTDTGVAVTDAASASTFDLPGILVANFGEGAASEATPLPAGVVLTNGAFVPGTLRSLDEPEVQLGPTKVQRSSIAAIVFSPTPHSAIYGIPKGKTGAVLPNNGDFFEGGVSGLKENAVTVSSTLFGPHRFDIKKQITAVILQDIQTRAARYEIGTKSGSRYFPNDVRVEHDWLLLNDSILGQMKVSWGDLAEIRAGIGRYQLLTDLKPVSAVQPNGADAAASVAINDEEGEAFRTLSTGANVAVSYTIPSGFTAFMCKITLPKGSSPAARLVFSVFCDGRIVFRSAPVSPVMNPQNLRVNLGNAQRLTLRVDPATPDSGAGVGKWMAPILSRQ